jgi:phosphatidate cytidylyltransferase
MLGWRLFLSAIMIPAFIGGFYFDAQFGPGAPFLCVLAVVLAARSSWELVDLLKIRAFRPDARIVVVCTVAVVAANWIPRWSGSASAAPVGVGALGPSLLAFTVCLLALFLNAALRYREPGNSMESLGAEVLAVAYVGILLSVSAQLRWVAGADAGYLALGSLIIATKSGDIGAYTLGRLLGKRKMMPRLSPGKTWAGAYGAVLGAGAASWAWFTLATPLLIPGGEPCPAHWAILFGVIIGIVGLIGDLCESLIKRDVGRKDSAVLLPGFGGVLDILDCILYAGPVAYILWLVLPLGPQ